MSEPKIRFVEPEGARVYPADVLVPSPEQAAALDAAWRQWCDEVLRHCTIRFGLPAHLVGPVPPEPESDTPIVVETNP